MAAISATSVLKRQAMPEACLISGDERERRRCGETQSGAAIESPRDAIARCTKAGRR